MSIGSEVEFSPKVQQWIEGQGYCVHGEVAVHALPTMVDHIGHTGPCHDPDDLVAVEMKASAGKQLRKQMGRLVRRNVAHEVYAAVYREPRSDTLDKWRDYFDDYWKCPPRPYLLYWDDEVGCFQTLYNGEPIEEDRTVYRRDKLLLVEANKGVDAGYSSKDDRHEALTPWVFLMQRLKTWVADQETFTTKECREKFFESDDPCVQTAVDPYSNPSRLCSKMLRVLADEEGVLDRAGKSRYLSYMVVDDQLAGGE
jgi:hypothetical protein